MTRLIRKIPKTVWVIFALLLNLYYLLMVEKHNCVTTESNRTAKVVLRHGNAGSLNSTGAVNGSTRSDRTHGAHEKCLAVETNSKYANRNVPVGHAPSCSGCMIRDFRRLHEPRFSCQKNGSDVMMIALVSSSVANAARRHAVRQTWGSLAVNNTSSRLRVVFMIGLGTPNAHHELISEEVEQYGDILQEDFLDTYENLTYKTLMGFTWASHKCPDTKYVIKTDDDVFFNIEGLEKLFSDWQKVPYALTTQIMGYCQAPAPAVRDRAVKWHVPYSVYPYDYPGYCSGVGYVVTMDTAREIVRVSPDIPFIYLEDVYIGFCIDKLGYEFRGVKGFNSVRVDVPPAECLESRDVLTSHGYLPQELLDVWEKCNAALA